MTGWRRVGAALVVMATVAGLPSSPRAGHAQQAASAASPSLADRMTGAITGVHDPAIIKAGDTYYVFSTSRPEDGAGQIPIRTSKDLVTWTRAGFVFPALPAWAKHEIPNTGGIWAPDISFVDGEYRLYYAVSSFGSNHSAIGLATTKTLDPTQPNYGWTDHGLVFTSARGGDYNAIDPAAFVDRDGKAWLAFGSFWTGIKLIALNRATGTPAADKTMHSLIQRSTPDAVEAPFLIERGGYYYLFASFDFCCRGANSSYYTVVGRSKDVTGPYVDYDGKPMMKGFAQIVLHAKLDPTNRWRGPGHPGLMKDGDRFYIAFHAYDAKNRGIPTLRIAPLGWTADGWPVARP